MANEPLRGSKGSALQALQKRKGYKLNGKQTGQRQKRRFLRSTEIHKGKVDKNLGEA